MEKIGSGDKLDKADAQRIAVEQVRQLLFAQLILRSFISQSERTRLLYE